MSSPFVKHDAKRTNVDLYPPPHPSMDGRRGVFFIETTIRKDKGAQVLEEPTLNEWCTENAASSRLVFVTQHLTLESW